MADHFEYVGITDVLGAIDHAVANGQAHERDDGGPDLRLAGRERRLAVHASAEDSIVCAFPSFRTELTIPVRTTEFYEDDECPFCATPTLDLIDAQGELITRLASQLEDLDAGRRDLAPTQPRTARLAAFAEELRSWAGEEEFERDEGGLAVQSLIRLVFSRPLGWDAAASH
jgi:hypothetical protein